MSDIDSFYKNAGAYTMFDKLKPSQTVYFNRTIWPNGDSTWLGPWNTQGKAQCIADFLKIKRVKTTFILRVTKRR